MKNFKNWIFYIPIIGEIYLLNYWGITNKYPLNISTTTSGVYQGVWMGLLLIYLLLK